jgi:hypothetical protein
MVLGKIVTFFQKKIAIGICIATVQKTGIAQD